MNILHIVETFNLSGRSRIIEQLAIAVSLKGHKVVILALSEATYVSNSSSIKVMVLNKGRQPLWQTVRSLLKVVTDEKIQIVHSHGKSGLLYGLIVKVLNNHLRFLFTAHRSSGEELRGNSILNYFIRKELDGCVGVSNTVRNNFCTYYKFPESKSSVIYNGINVEQFHGLKQPKCNVCFTMGTVANLSKDKDYLTLIRAFKIFYQHNKNARLVIVGDGPLLNELKSFVKSLDLIGQIDFLGRREDVHIILCTLDLFVLSSKTEGFPVSLLEAMAARIPVIASDLPAIREIVCSGVNGLLFEVGDFKKLSEQMIILEQNVLMRDAFAEKGFETVKAKFGLDQMILGYLNLYLSMKG